MSFFAVRVHQRDRVLGNFILLQIMNRTDIQRHVSAESDSAVFAKPFGDSPTEYMLLNYMLNRLSGWELASRQSPAFC